MSATADPNAAPGPVVGRFFDQGVCYQRPATPPIMEELNNYLADQSAAIMPGLAGILKGNVCADPCRAVEDDTECRSWGEGCPGFGLAPACVTDPERCDADEVGAEGICVGADPHGCAQGQIGYWFACYPDPGLAGEPCPGDDLGYAMVCLTACADGKVGYEGVCTGICPLFTVGLPPNCVPVPIIFPPVPTVECSPLDLECKPGTCNNGTSGCLEHWLDGPEEPQDIVCPTPNGDRRFTYTDTGVGQSRGNNYNWLVYTENDDKTMLNNEPIHMLLAWNVDLKSDNAGLWAHAVGEPRWEDDDTPPDEWVAFDDRYTSTNKGVMGCAGFMFDTGATASRTSEVSLSVRFTSMDLTYDHTAGWEVSHTETISLDKTWEESLSLTRDGGISLSSAFSLGFSASRTETFNGEFTVSTDTSEQPVSGRWVVGGLPLNGLPLISPSASPLPHP